MVVIDDADTCAFHCEPVADGTACDDGDQCTFDDKCQGGACMGTQVSITSVDGPCVLAVNEAGTFTAMANDTSGIEWMAPGGMPDSGMGASLTTSFAAEGDKTVTASCASSSASKTVSVAKDCAGLMEEPCPAGFARVGDRTCEKEETRAPGAGAFGQVQRLAHSADYVECAKNMKWCFRLKHFKEEHGVGVQSLGRTDIAGANDADVTPAACQAIITDLTPPAAGAGSGPPRTMYWSETITTAHEHFHVTDFRGRVTVPTGTDLATFVAQDSNCTDCKSSVPAAFNTQMETIWNGHRPSYFDGNHEVRAHDHSNPMYTALIDAIRQRARNAPAAEGWPAACQ